MKRYALIPVSMVLVLIAVSQTLADVIQWRVQDGGNGHWYDRIDTSQISWEQAKSDAELRGGYLATITSANENVFITQNLLSGDPYPNSGKSWWIGGFQSPGATGPADAWNWITGEPWSYTNWYSGEPNDAGQNETVLAFLPGPPGQQTGFWNDQASSPTTTEPAYLIEYAVPEPSTFALLSVGCIGLLGYGWRRRLAA